MRNSISLLPVSDSFLPLPSEEWMQASGFMPLSGRITEKEDYVILSPMTVESSTEMIAAYLGVKGMVTTLSTACSSAANAIMLGARLIRHGYAGHRPRRWNGCLMPFHAQRFQFIDDTGQRALPSFRPHTCRIKPGRRSRIPCSSIGEIPY